MVLFNFQCNRIQFYIVLLYFIFALRYRKVCHDICQVQLHYGNGNFAVTKLLESSWKLFNISKMVPPFVRLREAFLISPKYNLATCQIEKIMSTFRSGMFCYLNRKNEFLETGRSVSTEHWLNSLCDDHLYERTFSDVNNLLGNDLLLFTLVREPIQRFLSGYVDKCITETPPHWMESCKCFCCEQNITCFVHRLKQHLIDYHRFQRVSSQTDFYYMRHFAPLTWYCNFGTTLQTTYLINYDRKQRVHVAKEFNKVLLKAGVSNSDRNYVQEEMLKQLPAHATLGSKEREMAKREFFLNYQTRELFMEIYYYDFVVFNFKLPAPYLSEIQ